MPDAGLPRYSITWPRPASSEALSAIDLMIDKVGRLFRWRIFVLLPLDRQGLRQCLSSAFQFGQVVVDGCLQDRVVGVGVRANCGLQVTCRHQVDLGTE